MKKPLYLSFAANLILLVGVIGLYAYTLRNNAGVPARLQQTSPASAYPLISGWKGCNYPGFGFQFQYPPDWKVYVYSKSAGGGYPHETLCGAVDASALNPGVTVSPAPNWDRSLEGIDVSPQNPAIESLHPVASTGTVAGRPANILQNGTVVVNGYQIEFGTKPPSSTREGILEKLRFVSE